MTRFFCQELLYDYVTGELGPERKAEVDAYLKTDEVCREDLARIKKAMGYCQSLSQIQTPDEWVERWRHLPPALAKRISNWEIKLVSKLWGALPYTVSIVVLALGLVIFKPWRTLFKKEVVVWSATPPTSTETSATVTPAMPPTPPSSVAKPTLPSAVASSPPAPVAAPSAPAPLPPPAKPSVPESSVAAVGGIESKEALLKSEELGPNEKVEDIATTTILGPPREHTVAKDEEDEKPAALREGAKGELYRWFLDAGDFENVTDEIRQKIIALHGEKARKVELGWHSKDDESYFHFTLPESNRDELIKYIKTFGPVRMLKEKHPVVMPQGKIRIILILKENQDAPVAAPAAAPATAPATAPENADSQGQDQNNDEESKAPQVP